MCVTNAVQFQLAHVCELLGQVPQARSKYEVLLGCRTVTSNIKALSQKQLGMCVLVCVYRILLGKHAPLKHYTRTLYRLAAAQVHRDEQ